MVYFVCYILFWILIDCICCSEKSRIFVYERNEKVRTQLHTLPVRNLIQYKLGKFKVFCSPVHCALPQVFTCMKRLKLIPQLSDPTSLDTAFLLNVSHESSPILSLIIDKVCFSDISSLHIYERNEVNTYLLTPWCRVLLENLTGLQLVKKFPAFHATQTFITALTSVRHLSLSWTSPIQSIYSHPTSWRFILILSTHLRLGLPSGPFPSGEWR